MTVRRTIHNPDGVYFITLTCYKWLKLFELTNAYDIVYKQFDHLRKDGHFMLGYVVMPNHIHMLVGFRNTGKRINDRIGTLKRFMAYEIVKRLKAGDHAAILTVLVEGVNGTDHNRGKLHEVFEPSFDCKECDSEKFIIQKLDYMHNNPCQGVWSLVESPVDYIHSSAKYYITGEQGAYPITSYTELMDIDLTILNKL